MVVTKIAKSPLSLLEEGTTATLPKSAYFCQCGHDFACCLFCLEEFDKVQSLSRPCTARAHCQCLFGRDLGTGRVLRQYTHRNCLRENILILDQRPPMSQQEQRPFVSTPGYLPTPAKARLINFRSTALKGNDDAPGKVPQPKINAVNSNSLWQKRTNCQHSQLLPPVQLDQGLGQGTMLAVDQPSGWSFDQVMPCDRKVPSTSWSPLETPYQDLGILSAYVNIVPKRRLSYGESFRSPEKKPLHRATGSRELRQKAGLRMDSQAYAPWVDGLLKATSTDILRPCQEKRPGSALSNTSPRPAQVEGQLQEAVRPNPRRMRGQFKSILIHTAYDYRD